MIMKHFKKVLCVMLAALMLASFAACSGNSGDGAKKKLVMATNAYFPPYEYYEGQDIVGIDVEIMAAIAEKMGCDFKVEDMEFDSIINAVDSGKADVGLAGMTVTEDRLKNVDFSDSYATSKQVIIVPEDSAIASPDDLNNVKIGVQLGTTGDIYISGDIEDGVYTGSSVEQYNSGMEAVLSLTQGKIDAVVIDEQPAKVFVEKNEGLKILDAEYVEEEYAIAVKKGNTELLDQINKVLAEMKENGELQQIIDKYITAD